MKAVPVKIIEGKGYRQCDIAEATHVGLCLPGPNGRIFLPVITKGTRAGTGCWTWNGSTDTPTLKPSVLTQAGHFAPHFNTQTDTCWCKYYQQHPEEKFERSFECYRCHTWINDGRAQFLGDCSHKLANQTLDLLDVKTDDLQ